MGEVVEKGSPPRVRSVKDIDFTKAKNHNRCNGTGVVAYKTFEDPTKKGKFTRVPIVCRCVTQRGGVKLDVLDKMAIEIDRQLREGIFGEQLASDLRRLPAEARALKVSELQRTMAAEETEPRLREQIKKALDILNQEEA